ncbi:MAG TPA: protease inhibitor I42 family protein [Anaerolineales bacterium]|mgnify:CR=1 FL=1|nr:protease inhibitor I42 family protein [Anaerolineales bacterium]
MKKLFILLVLALTLAACGGKPAETSELPFNISEAGKTIEVAAGNEFKIVIESNPSTGYHWDLVGALDESIVQFVSRDYRADEPAAPGSGGRDVWTFKAVAAGETTVTLGYFPPGVNGTAAQEVTFTIVVK